jgi:outer membrane protein TolC
VSRLTLLAALFLALAHSAVRAQAPAEAPQPSPSDSLALTLGEALSRAAGQSQEVRLARSAVELAGSQVTAARAAALPQIEANLSYTRTIESPFSSGTGFTLPDSLRFEPDTSAALAERVRYLERNAGTAGLAGIGGLFGNLPFGRENSYVASLSGTQVLYAGGRVGAALRIADSYRDAARDDYREQLSEIELQVRTAYYRAALARELGRIARAALDQALAFLEEERLRLRAGTASELDVMRAEVAAENLRPQLVEATSSAELALLDLQRLVDIPLARPVRLTTALEAPPAAEAPVAPPELAIGRRGAVSAGARQVEIREEQVRIARGAFLPSVSLRMSYGGQLYPATALDLGGTDWRPDVSASVGVSLPIFSGFQRKAELDEARVNLERSRLQLAQLREAVQLQYERARGERERALASIAARRRTVEQAQRVHDLTVLRYEQGLATQLEVSDARLALLRARTNVAQAIADFHIADAALTRALGATTVAAR